MPELKYPIGIQSFEKLRNDGYVYVDKTDIVYKLVNSGSYFFFSRPRRFGKSLLVSTLAAYFSGKRELFKGLAIEELEKDWTEYPVLHIDLNTGKYDSLESLNYVLNDFLYKQEAVYGSSPSETTLELRFKGLIERVAERHGRRVVILVDEYDKPMLQAVDNPDLQAGFRNTLKAFYSVLKTQDQYIRFAFLTGVTKFGKVSVFSDLNNLSDISMDARFQTICGITEEEISRYFQPALRNIAEASGVSVERAHEMLKERYDGYHFRQYGKDIYNPFSLLSTFASGEMGSYWFATGTPTFLVRLLQHDNFPLPELTEGEVSGELLDSIDSMDKSPLPVVYQSGYLTIKGYDDRFQMFRLGFPNKEVEEGFIKFLIPYYTSVRKGESASFIGNFIRDLETGSPESFMERMSSMLSDTDYKIVGDTELYFQNAFYIVSKMLGFYTEVERTTSNGRMDLVVQTRSYVYIIEFKMDQSPEAALRQIDDKGYAAPFASDSRRLYKIGVNFSRARRCIDGWKIE